MVQTASMLASVNSINASNLRCFHMTFLLQGLPMDKHPRLMSRGAVAEAQSTTEAEEADPGTQLHSLPDM